MYKIIFEFLCLERHEKQHIAALPAMLYLSWTEQTSNKQLHANKGLL